MSFNVGFTEVGTAMEEGGGGMGDGRGCLYLTVKLSPPE